MRSLQVSHIYIYILYIYIHIYIYIIYIPNYIILYPYVPQFSCWNPSIVPIYPLNSDIFTHMHRLQRQWGPSEASSALPCPSPWRRTSEIDEISGHTYVTYVWNPQNNGLLDEMFWKKGDWRFGRATKLIWEFEHPKMVLKWNVKLNPLHLRVSYLRDKPMKYLQHLENKHVKKMTNILEPRSMSQLPWIWSFWPHNIGVSLCFIG